MPAPVLTSPPPSPPPHPNDELDLPDTITVVNWNCQIHAPGSYIPPDSWTDEHLITPFFLGDTGIPHPSPDPSWNNPSLIGPDGSTTLIDATRFLDSIKKGLVDAGIIDNNGNPLKVPTPMPWNERMMLSGWAEGSGSQEHPIDVDNGQGTHFFPINVDSGSPEFLIMVEDDSLALAIPVPVTPALPLFLAESDGTNVDV